MQKIKERILIVCPEFPFPTHHGGQVDIWRRIKYLTSIGYVIDIISTDHNKIESIRLEKIKRQIKGEIFLVPRKNSIIKMLSLLPLQVSSRSLLKEINFKNRRYDFIFLESEYVGEILKNKTLSYTKAFLRRHNDESNYFNELFKSESILYKKIYFKIESLKFKHYSKKLFLAFDKIFSISKLEKLPNSLNNIHLPTPIELEKFKKININNQSSKTVLFIGNLFTPNNIESLEFYVNHVHKHLIPNS